MNDDLWKAMRGSLPCLDVSSSCVRSLQDKAIANNRTLKEIDKSIEEINTKIAEARKTNQKAVTLGIFRPVVQAYLKVDTPAATATNPNPQPRGFFSRILNIFRNPLDIVDEVLGLIGIPLFEGATNTNAEANRNSIAIADLQTKVAALQKGRADLAEKIRDSVQTQVLDFDTSAREFQLSQELAKRGSQRLAIIQLNYKFGEGTSESYLNQLAAMDEKKGSTLRAWTKMRSQLERIKLIVLEIPET
jgi:hypothetical protein